MHLPGSPKWFGGGRQTETPPVRGREGHLVHNDATSRAMAAAATRAQRTDNRGEPDAERTKPLGTSGRSVVDGSIGDFRGVPRIAPRAGRADDPTCPMTRRGGLSMDPARAHGVSLLA